LSIVELLGVGWSVLVQAALGGPVRLSRVGANGERRTELVMYVDPTTDTDGELEAVVVRLEDVRSPARRPASPPAPAAVATPATSTDPFAPLFGEDARILQIKQTAARFARSNVPVLVLSETGTGKELLAKAIHDASDRARRAFVAINCGAISEALLTTELFGYGSGAFSGAQRGGCDGKLAAADGGTLFLDEIAEMPPSLQAMLLRVLENGSYYRVGESVPRHTDIRLISATCRDLRGLIADGRFRDDLSYRIKGAVLGLPPLRDRTDIAELAAILLASLTRESGRPECGLDDDVIALFRRHPWPGNVRELKAALQYALVVADGEQIRLEHLPEELLSAVGTSPPADDATALERSLLGRAMDEARGKVDDAARALGVSRATLYRKLKRMRLKAK
jgi:transcriptional regulator with PAS, ATPase and Fis domain